MHFLSATAVLLHIILLQEVAAVPALDALNVAAIGKCQQKPQICGNPNDCSWGYSDVHRSCKELCGNGANAAYCCDQQLFCWSSGGGIGT